MNTAPSKFKIKGDETRERGRGKGLEGFSDSDSP
jgi:hypothetical protein